MKTLKSKKLYLKSQQNGHIVDIHLYILSDEFLWRSEEYRFEKYFVVAFCLL